MFYQHSNGSSTLPRDFRFHHGAEDCPTTPEASAPEEPRQPSPPRPARLKVRRRHASSTFQAPTEHFLASVAAADIPIPTIEEPQVAEDGDYQMTDQQPLSIQTSFLTPHSFRSGSPPKTPMPTFSNDENYSQLPDWSASTSSPAGDYFGRPNSSHSTAGSDFSDDSLYSCSRVSRPSEDGSCTSPESDAGDPFQYSSTPGKGKGKALFIDQPAEPVTTLNAKLRSKTRNDAPWTEAQNQHLWSTYLLYLSDPTVTPFRIGHSAVPPQGIIHRVAREAKRSWKGPRISNSAVRRSTTSRRVSDTSGSLTPTGESAKSYAQWPHSSKHTRNHLRDLCRRTKNSDSNLVQLHHHLQSRSPTPFTKPYRAAYHETEPRSMFNTSDIALSLATSTAESMQPDGPLAKLGADELDTPTSSFPSLKDCLPPSFEGTQEPESKDRSRILGSPFVAHTYGPSSSTMDSLRPPQPRTRSDTVGESRAPRLGSPVRFNEPRSLNCTMKRRAQHSLDEEFGANGAIVRPSILNEQIFGAAFPGNRRRVRTRGFSLGDEALSSRPPTVFQFPPVPTLPVAAEIIEAATAKPPPSLLPSATFERTRLGSPFSESGPSNTFPRRLFQDTTATVRRSAFATMHQTRRSIESFDFGEGPSLQSRLFHLDSKLKEIKERETAARKE
ncbi:hypothetical protein B0O99DRAFT_519797 [Bisporella sp. PMI_857]|nr:hypothetical protein B0O99DRAFT_519797 [Bisporella sp. PMI_857]